MINIIIDTDPRYHVSHTMLRQAVQEVFKKHLVSGKVEVGVLVVGDRKMQDLNLRFRGLDKTTDVLSFPLEDPTSQKNKLPHGFARSPDRVIRLGDVVVSYPQAVLSAAEEEVTVDQYIKFLTQHGVEHLLGFHHQDELL